MRSFALVCAVLAGGAATAMLAAPAQAQATRTWVSGVGDDVNPCSRTAPCKTFAGAISKTAAGGEINCLDPGGFGAVTIIKSMTIACQYTEGGALAGGNGIVVNMPAATDVTVIRGLDIFGVNPPTNGIRFVNNGTLHVIETKISRFNAASSQGISFQPTGNAKLFVTDTYISENGNGATGGGILIQPTSTGSANVVLRNVTVANNANNGILVSSSGNTGAGINVTIVGSNVSGNANGIVAQSTLNNAPVKVAIDATTIIANVLGLNSNAAAGGNGVGSAVVRIGDSNVSLNATGASVTGSGQIFSYKDNYINGNGTDGPVLTQVNMN